MNKMKFVTIIICFTIIPILIFFCKYKEVLDFGVESSSSSIIFFWQPDRKDSKVMRLVHMDEVGNNLRVIGLFSGTATFSHDGKRIAAGCMPDYDNKVTEICIIDVSIFKSIRGTMQVEFDKTDNAITNRIQLPEVCLSYQSSDPSVSEILSIDWSPESDRLLVVCGTNVSQDVCIVPLEGEPKCWDHEATERIFRAVWSPVDENKLLTSGWDFPVSKINLVDQNGIIIKQIAEGMNPEWSSDGTKIAFIENATDPLVTGRSQGIAVIDSDGLNHKWVYYPEFSPEDYYILLDGFDTGRRERLAWSPDEKTIVFSGNYGGFAKHGLFKLDVNTGYYTFFLDPWIFSNLVVEPDWSPK